MRRLLVCVFLSGTQAAFFPDRAFAEAPAAIMGIAPAVCRPGSQAMARVELYFGAGRVAANVWRAFLASAVTPRFPDGLTVLDAKGQWRGPHGIEREPSRVMVIVFVPDGDSDRKIEAIRDAYKRRFHQQSVLRVDSGSCVSF